MELILKKAVKINGVETSVIPYDLDDLTGKDFIQAEKEVAKLGHVVTIQELDPLLNVAIFAQASGLTIADLQNLSIKDYSKVGTIVRDFMFQESEDSPQPITEEE